MVAGRKAPYMHSDGSDCYTRNCRLDHANSVEDQNKAIYEDFNKKMNALQIDHDAALLKAELGTPALTRTARIMMGEEVEPEVSQLTRTARIMMGEKVEPETQEIVEASPLTRTARIMMGHEEVSSRLCGDYPAPCNCDDSVSHDESVSNFMRYNSLTTLDGIIPSDSQSVQNGAVEDEILHDGTLYSRVRKGVGGGDFSSMRIQANRSLTEDEAYRLSGMVGYAYVKSIAGEKIYDPTQDSPYSLVISADSTKSARDDLGDGIYEFEEALKEISTNGSPRYKTDRKGPIGSQKVEGFGDDFKVEIYYDSVYRD